MNRKNHLDILAEWLEENKYQVKLQDSHITIKAIEEMIEKNEFNIVENNLSSLKEFIEFFTAFFYFIMKNRMDMIGLCLRKLEYLGFECNGIINMISSKKNDILSSMIQCAYILEKEDNELNREIYKSFLEKIKKMEK